MEITLLIIVSLSLFLIPVAKSQGGLKSGFYSSTCPKAEATVRSTVETHFKNDPTVAAGILRLHFHDCFVEGCDGSILIKGRSAEINALPNLGLRGFEVINDAKTQLEALCPGRRDGRVSSSSKASNLPSPLDSVDTQRQKFADKGLDDQDLVTLAGAHTIGQTDCRFFRYRLYNFTTTGNSDPSLSQSALTNFQTLCPKSSSGTEQVALDKDSPMKFDVSYFKNVRDGNGVLESDQRLWGDPATRDIVQNYAGRIRGLLGLRFDYEFKKSMIKMSSIEVKTGAQGEIRKVCSRFN
ncbi:heme peroxidase [Cynara cardunculus var. scolymus]|uniref:Peroxidase n=1 Tax=Cynara cardunculus var. scolymus TaxID=59895 RepID=A0A103XN65_CYNCS|nr:heme peroxidase [Cynara cardunculus var. scolymus]